MVQLKFHLGATLAPLCVIVPLVAGNPVRLAEDKRPTGSVSHTGFHHISHFGTRTEEHHSWWTRTGSTSHISHLSHDGTHTKEHHHSFTKTGTDAHVTSHHEHTRTDSHKSHETEHRTSLGHDTTSLKTPGHYTVEKREVSVIFSHASSFPTLASHEIPHPSHGPHTATHHTHSTHRSHKEHPTRTAASHTLETVHPTSTGQTASVTPVASLPNPASVSHFLPTDEWFGRGSAPETVTFTWPSLLTVTYPSIPTGHPSYHPRPSHNPRDIEEEQRHHKSTSEFTFNPSTLQTATTIALPSTTYCVTTLYLPHSPVFGSSTKTVWTSTATFYPEWDCHGCASLTVLDPWTMGQPTSHYHHTKTSKSIVTVVSPVCKATQTSIGVILTAA
ncbi:hypothetical protein V8E51_008489 [Hyaloscypha variabilis]|uniref:Uncharacterized protein n=1 Tax=Hyaloscypha variabilis (strain UAMH 11265 / GT02V1 / F) TaxID=1149755 RepID=A0A2J6S1N2_HYAVF|nr:hypothetical protein L207DRAFT_579582 [Hyaloscypha variabilis F]